MLPWIIALYVLSAFLPIVGLSRLLIAARRESRAVAGAARRADGVISIGQFDAAIGPLIQGVLGRPRAIITDFATIGAGVILGCVASIMSLFL